MPSTTDSPPGFYLPACAMVLLPNALPSHGEFGFETGQDLPTLPAHYYYTYHHLPNYIEPGYYWSFGIFGMVFGVVGWDWVFSFGVGSFWDRDKEVGTPGHLPPASCKETGEETVMPCLISLSSPPSLSSIYGCFYVSPFSPILYYLRREENKIYRKLRHR